MPSEGPWDRDPSDYQVRAYEPGDEEAVVALHNRVWGGDRSLTWFRWKYVDDPYLDTVPVYLVTNGAELVGLFGLVPFRMRAGEETGLGMLSGDLVVHPDHRGRRVFTGLLGSLLDDGVVGADEDDVPAEQGLSLDEGVDFLFAYANPLSHPGMRKLGWTDVSPRISYHRIHDPSSFVRDRFGPEFARATGPLLRGVARSWLRARTLGTGGPAGLTVEFHEDVPVDTLTTLARRGVPAGVSPVYDEAFYEWRFAGVSWTQDGTYVARYGDEPLAAVMVRERHDERLDATTLSLIHTVPLAGREREAGIAAILDRIGAERRDVSFLRAWNPVFPDRLLRERGFLPDDRPPLSWIGGPDLRLIAHSLSGEPFSDTALRESGPALWSLDK